MYYVPLFSQEFYEIIYTFLICRIFRRILTVMSYSFSKKFGFHVLFSYYFTQNSRYYVILFSLELQLLCPVTFLFFIEYVTVFLIILVTLSCCFLKNPSPIYLVFLLRKARFTSSSNFPKGKNDNIILMHVICIKPVQFLYLDCNNRMGWYVGNDDLFVLTYMIDRNIYFSVGKREIC